MQTYTGVFRYENAQWVGEVEDVPSAHTSGSDLPKTATSLKHTLAVVLDLDADDFEMVTRIHLT